MAVVSHKSCSLTRASCDNLTGSTDISKEGNSLYTFESTEFLNFYQIQPVVSPLTVEELCGFSLDELAHKAVAELIEGGQQIISLSSNAKEVHEEVSTSHVHESNVFLAIRENTITVVASEVVYKIQFEALSDVSECNIDEGEKVIYWHQGEGTYIHPASGMRYYPGNDMYYNFVSPNLDDPRELYYTPVNDVFMLVSEGQLGKANEEILNDKDWDRSFIYTENYVGYISNLVELFRAKIVERPHCDS